MSWRDRARHAVEKNRATPSPTKPTKGVFVSSVSSTPAGISQKSGDAWGYTPEDLHEMDELLREICELEGRSDEELEALRDERRRMAPVNVPKALAALRIARDQALAPWPESPTTRARITLCELVSKPKEFAVLEGNPTPKNQAKRLDSGKEAA